MVAGHVEVFAVVTYLMDLLGMRKDAIVTIPDHGVFFPASLEKLVQHFNIFRCHFIAVRVLAQAAFTDILRAAFQIRRDDIPSHAAFGEVIGS